MTWVVSAFAGVVPRELCQQQEHESGEGNPGATQGNLSKGRHEHVKLSEVPSSLGKWGQGHFFLAPH